MELWKVQEDLEETWEGLEKVLGGSWGSSGRVLQSSGGS